MIDPNKIKVSSVALSTIVDDRAENVRDAANAAQYDVTSLQADLLANGQKEPVLLYVGEDGNHHILQGYRRTLALKEANAAELLWEPEVPVMGGKPVAYISARVITAPLTQAEKIRLMLNDTSRRNLDIVGLQIAIDKCIWAGITEKETVSALLDLFQTFYPMKKKIILPDNPTFVDREAYKQALLTYYKGTLQQLSAASKGPAVLHEAWVNHLRDRDYPILRKQSDMVALSKVYREELEAYTTGLINRDAPGPKFRDAWALYLNGLEEAAATGKTKPTGLTMLPKSEVEKIVSALTSRTLKVMLYFILNKISRDNLGEFDALVSTMEKAAGHDFNATVDRIVGVNGTSTDPTAQSSDTQSPDSDLEASTESATTGEEAAA